MKIAYVTIYDSQDIQNWSGLGFFIAKALENQNINLEYIGQLNFRINNWIKLKEKYYNRKKLLLDYQREPFVVKQFARQIKERLSYNVDIIFSPSSIPLAFLDINKPIVFYTDATFAGMLGFYDEFSELCPTTIKHGNYVEQRALENSDLAIYSSEWAARTAIKNYIVDQSKIRIVPFGANIQCNRTLNDIQNFIKKRSHDECNLLFVGVDWIRKGGYLAIEIVKYLNELGLKTKLHIVGLNEIPIDPLPKYIVNHGYISKSNESGISKINRLYQMCHFLLVPSLAEAYGLVFCEANSFGLPSISTNVGGISTIIKNDVNGKMFDPRANASEWAHYILNTFNNKTRYYEFCLTSWNEYYTRLNWDTAGKSIVSLLKQL